jgi:hypothetical protein
MTVLNPVRRPAKLTALASRINDEHAAATRSACEALEHARRCGELLIEAKAKIGHGGFLAWLAHNCHVGERQARNYMRLADNWDALNRKRASDLSVREAMRLLSEELNGESNHDRYTPADLVDAVRQVLGGIDLDPASSEAANRTVKAKSFFNASMNGLTKRWHGRVFLNPPFDNWLGWITKLDQEIEAGRVKEAIVVGPANISAFRPLLKRGGMLFVADERPKFYDPSAGKLIDPPFGSLICYLGGRCDRFSAVFGTWGVLLQAVLVRVRA